MRFHQHSPYADWGFVDATIQAREELGDQTDDTRFTEYFAQAVMEMASEQGISFPVTPREVRHALRLGRPLPPPPASQEPPLPPPRGCRQEQRPPEVARTRRRGRLETAAAAQNHCGGRRGLSSPGRFRRS